ncbi:MAG: polysulfide reductase NrfD [Deltaproteobacteria bacterium]|nr:polysulfide reductase NrfD [Deltaproteobacteria bacterium]MBI2230219.1 polysulfide reductase NrfD [Deltaproteobacteria bacterium]MBI2366983.1 polysulfide reductase NrfD [Deltaproteobacteria bacterium]
MAARIDEFLIDVRPQREWGWLVISYLFLGGAGAGLFLVSLYLEHLWAGVLGLLVLLVGTVLLLLDLGRPERFWRAFFRPQTSWISRGCFFITLLFVLGVIELALQWPGLELPAWLSEGTTLRTSLRVAGGGAAVLVMIYTGFVLAPSPAIPFWNSAFFPIIFFAYSLLAGIDILILTSPMLPGPSLDLMLLERNQNYLVILCLLLVLSHVSVMSSSAVAARESIRLLTRGRWASLFLGGVIGAGLIVPLLLALPVVWEAQVQTVFALTFILALLRLFGDYLFRFLVMRVGLYDPLL